jgi:hypothetical protein
MIGANVTVDAAQFGPGLVRAWASQIRSSLDRAAKIAQRDARAHFRRALTRRLEYQALFQIVHTPSAIGLQGEFGLANPGSQADSIVDLAVNALVIKPLPVKANWLGVGRVTDFGGLQALIVPSELSFLTQSSYASFVSNSGYEVPWLTWLLESGSSVVIDDFYVLYGTNSQASRTGDAIMVPSGGSGKNFRIKQYYAGVQGNNWITRAGLDALMNIAAAMQEAVRRELS